MKSVNLILTPKDGRSIIVETAYMKEGCKVLDAEAAVKEAIKRSK